MIKTDNSKVNAQLLTENQRLREHLALAESYKASLEVVSEGYARLREEITALTEQLASAKEEVKSTKSLLGWKWEQLEGKG
jgi:cell shape-determining protein MreC